jgi:hypothetical protein
MELVRSASTLPPSFGQVARDGWVAVSGDASPGALAGRVTGRVLQPRTEMRYGRE